VSIGATDHVIYYKVPPPEMFDDYETGEYTPPPQAKEPDGHGRFGYVLYEVTVPAADGFSFKADRNGFLMAVIKGLTLENGYQLRHLYASSAPFPKKDKAGNVIGTRNASGFGNYLRAFGLAVRPQTPQEYQDLALATAGQTIQATIEWEAYDAEAQVTVADRWDQFPEDPAHPGCRLPYLERQGRRFWAHASVRRFRDRVA